MLSIRASENGLHARYRRYTPGKINSNNNNCRWFQYGMMESMETPYVFSSQRFYSPVKKMLHQDVMAWSWWGRLPEDRRAPVLSLRFYKINLVGIDYGQINVGGR